MGANGSKNKKEKKNNKSSSQKLDVFGDIFNSVSEVPVNEFADFEIEIHRFEKKNIKKWNKYDLSQFLENTDLLDITDIIMDIFEEDGIKMFELSSIVEIEDILKEDKLKLFYFKILWRNIKQNVKEKKKFSMKFFNVLRKYAAITITEETDLNEIDTDTTEYNLSILCDRNKIKKNFLDKSISQRFGTIPVKIIITESYFEAKELLARKVISPIANILPFFKTSFGMFHSSLLIGGLIFHFTKDALIIPKKIESSNAYLSFSPDIIYDDLDTTNVLKVDEIDEVKEKLATLIEKWNTMYEYRVVPRIGKTEGNCQTFVKAACDSLGISLVTQGALAEFLEKIRKKGVCKLEFTPNQEFKTTYKIDKKVISFKTHLELDDFVQKLYDINDIALTEQFIQEMTLLKSFDRAFWLRHLKDPDLDKFKPKTEKIVLPKTVRIPKNFNGIKCKCPFKDPRDTKSYMTTEI